GLPGAVDGRAAAADDGAAGAQLGRRRAHPDVAKERAAVEHAGVVFAFGAHAVRLGETNGQHAGVVLVLQLVPRDVLAHFGVRLDRDAQLHEALDLTIEHVLREHPVGNAAAIEAAGFRRLLQDRDLVAEAR